MDCPQDAALVVGHNARTRQELAEMIHEGRWTELIRRIPVKKGDFIQINPGTVHAIQGGMMIRLWQAYGQKAQAASCGAEH